MTRNLLFILLLLISAPLYSQDSPRSITARYTPDIIQVDGIMDEAA